MLKKFTALFVIALLAGSLAACQTQSPASSAADQATTVEASAASEQTSAVATAQSSDAVITTAHTTADGAINAGELFTTRDLTQTPDSTDATHETVSDGQSIQITAAGTYYLSGSASDVTITVDVGDEDKVQLVLDGVSITNTDAPCIYVKNADKVFVTTTETENTLAVTGAFTADGNTNTDAVIFSKDDLVLNGLGSLTINSSENGVSCKDDLKITGGTLNITCSADALEANDAIAIADGSITIKSQKDGIHAENDEDNSVGYVYICGGTLDITAADDGVHATTVAQLDDGNVTINAAEGVEATFVQINGGALNITASDDGINGAHKSDAYTVTVEINGGDITISMGQGDTDAIDSNGNLYINGGTLNITAQSPFDYDGEARYTGGKMIVNGTETTTITNQMMGGGMGGNRMQPNGMDGNQTPPEMPNGMMGNR